MSHDCYFPVAQKEGHWACAPRCNVPVFDLDKKCLGPAKWCRVGGEMATFGYCGVSQSALVEFDPAPEPAESERRTAEVWVITVSRETDLPRWLCCHRHDRPEPLE